MSFAPAMYSMSSLLFIIVGLILNGKVSGQALRCPVVDPYQLVCQQRIENLCVTDASCAEGFKCCPSADDLGCTLQCTQAEVLEGCPYPVDLALLVDGSGSISRRNFLRLKEFIERLVDSFDVSEAGTHVALIEYSTEASIQLKFKDFSNAQINAVNVKRRVQQMPHNRGFTYIDKALNLANTEVFTTEGGMRDDVAKVVILLTDGVQTVPQGSTRWTTDILNEAAAPLKRKGIIVNTVGIGRNIDLVDLVTLATGDTNVYLAETFADLGDLITELEEGECPVDGNWSDWEEWSVCTQTCGGGTRRRTRKCDNPAPAAGGQPCKGPADEEEACNEDPCPIDGNWSKWGDWDACPVTCGGGVQNRSRTCTNPASAFGGELCPGESDETRSCNEDPCPVDGNWSEWNDWSTCSVTCGGGVQNRSRTCTNPAPAFGGEPCPGESDETRSCNEHPCPADGNWSEWGDWSLCSLTCGGGMQNRSRTCTNPPPAFGGASCPGESGELRFCNEDPCPVNGNWSEWGNWTTCSVTCGGGTQLRNRSCDNPAPAFGGLDCPGNISEEIRDCSTDKCPQAPVLPRRIGPPGDPGPKGDKVCKYNC